MAGQDIAEFEMDNMVRDAVWTTMAGDGSIGTATLYSLVNDKIGMDVPLWSSGDWVFGIVANFPKGVLKSASAEIVARDKLAEAFWFAVGDNMLGLDDGTGVLFVQKNLHL